MKHKQWILLIVVTIAFITGCKRKPPDSEKWQLTLEDFNWKVIPDKGELLLRGTVRNNSPVVMGPYEVDFLQMVFVFYDADGDSITLRHHTRLLTKPGYTRWKVYGEDQGQITDERNKLLPHQKRRFKYSVKQYDPNMHSVEIIVYYDDWYGVRFQVPINKNRRILDESSKADD